MFPAEPITDVFPSGRDRPSSAREVIAWVLVLQSFPGYSDREAVDALTLDLRWRADCGCRVDVSGLHPSTLM